VSHLSAAAEDFHDIGRSFTLMARYEEKIAQSVGQYTPNGSSAVQRAADLQAAGYASLRQHAVDKQVRWGVDHHICNSWWHITEVMLQACLPR
jgi:hypothetical protein